MRTLVKFSMLALAGVLFTAGCNENKIDQFVESETQLPDEVIRTIVDGEELITFRTINPNGTDWNGTDWNGTDWNGTDWNGPDFTDWLLNDIPDIIGVHINDDGKLEVTRPNGKQKVSNSDKIKVRFKIDDVVYQIKLSQLEDGGITEFMRVQWRELGAEAWDDLCKDADGNPVKAALLTGAYDVSTGQRINNADNALFACRGSSIAKATEHGYHEDDPHHEAMVRMYRADYCGDGVSHTVTGTPIDIESDDGNLTHDTAWPVEAGWNDSGVVCLNNPRKTFVNVNGLPCQPPPCTDEVLADPAVMFVTRALPTD